MQIIRLMEKKVVTTLMNEVTIYKKSYDRITLVAQLILYVCQRLQQRGVILLPNVRGILFQNQTKGNSPYTIWSVRSWMMILKPKTSEEEFTKTHNYSTSNLFLHKEFNFYGKIFYETFKNRKLRNRLSRL